MATDDCEEQLNFGTPHDDTRSARGIDSVRAEPQEQGDTDTRWWKINKQLLPVKGFYFMIHTALATVQPYIMVYLKQQGLSASESGVLFGSMPFLSFLAQPLVGAAADRWLKHKVVLVSATILTGLFHLLFLAVPSRTGDNFGSVFEKDVKKLCEENGVPRFSVCGEVDGAFWYLLPECVNSNSDHVNSSNESVFPLCTASQGAVDSENVLSKCPDNIISVLHSISHSTGKVPPAYECYIRCDQTSVNDRTNEFSVCFQNNTDGSMYTVCNETVSYQFLPQSLQVHNVSYFRRSVKDSGDLNGMCYLYNLTSFSSSNTTYERIVCLRESTSECKLRCEILPAFQNMCTSNAHLFDVTFWATFLIFMAGYLLQAPVTPMADTAVYWILKERRDQFGRQRLWGSLGYLAASGAVSLGTYLTQQANNEMNFSIVFIAYAVLCAISAAVALGIQFPKDVRCGNMLKNACRLITMPKILCFLLVVFYHGFMMGAIVSFLFWYLLDLGAPSYMFGLTRLFCVVCEIPVFLFSGRLVKRFGPVPVLCLSIVTMSVRLMAYSLLGNPWFVLLVEPLHGVTFPFMITAATTYASIVSPPGMAATTQGLVGGVLWGLGRGAGALVTGVVFTALGARLTYGLFSASGIGVLLMYGLLHYCVFKESPGNSKTPEPEVEMTSKGGDQEPEAVETQQPLMNQHEKSTDEVAENGILPSIRRQRPSVEDVIEV